MADRTINIVVQKTKAQTQIDELNKGVKDTGKSVDKLTNEVDKFGNELKQTDKEMGRFIDKSGRMREANGRYVKGLSSTNKAQNQMLKGLKGLNGGMGSFTSASLLANTPTTALVATMTAAAASAVALADNFATAAVEIDNLAGVAGVGVEEFQELTFASTQFGVEQQKLSDILKDVNDKVGDFVKNDGGEFKEVFENVLEPLGYTVEQLKEMSSPQVLRAVAEGMQELGFNTQETTQAMEAIANDATLLNKLYADQGKELDRLTSKYKEVSNPLTDDDVKKAREYKEEIALLNTQWSTFTRELGEEVIPLVTAFAKQLNTAVSALNELISKSNKVSTVSNQDKLNNLIAREIKLQKELEVLKSSQVDLSKKEFDSVFAYQAAKSDQKKAADEILKTEQELLEISQKRSDLESSIATSKKTQSKESNTEVNSKTNTVSKTGLPSDFGQTNTVDLFSLNSANKLDADLNALRESLKSQEDLILDSYLNRQLLISDAQNLGKISENEANELSKEAYQQYEDAITEIALQGSQTRAEADLDARNKQIEEEEANAERLSNIYDSASSNISNSLSSAFIDAATESENFGDAAINIVGQVAASVAQQLLAQQIQAQITKATNAATLLTTTTAEAGAAVGLAGANAVASTAAIPITGPALAPAAGAAASLAAGGFASQAIAAASVSGLQTGGAASGNSAYEVNELGMESYRRSLTKNGERDVLLTGREGGKVTRSDKVNSGSGTNLNVSVENYASGVDHSVQQIDENTVKIIATKVFNSNIDEGVSNVMGNTNTKTRKQMNSSFSIKKKR